MKLNPKVPQSPPNEPLLVVTVGLGQAHLHGWLTYYAKVDEADWNADFVIDQSQQVLQPAEQRMTAPTAVHFGAFDQSRPKPTSCHERACSIR